MPIALFLALALGATQQPSTTPELATISARLGSCAADFTVTDADGAPIYAATVHVRVRYGFMGLKRMDLEVGTNSDGKARVEGLPANARPLVYTITKGDLKATVEQNPATTCVSTHRVALK
jgi:hypothetical protein